jgi:DNA-directed RNA polymerase sigma subunit (sigma70/sigma32)
MILLNRKKGHRQMAKLTMDELKASLKTLIGDNTDDASIKFLEDFNDTISDAGSDNGDGDWKKKYDDLLKDKEELDKAWRKRYTERFFSAEDSHTDNKNETKNDNPADNAHKTTEEIDKEEEANKVRFDDLFKPADQ